MLKTHNISLTISLFLTSRFRRWERRQIRMMMRGYRYLKQQGRLHIIEDTVQHLREYQLHIPSNSLPCLLWGEALPSAELIVRQRLSSHYLDLAQALLIASSKPNGCVIAPVPKPWRIELQRLGFGIDHFRCSLAWNLHLIQHFCFGIFKAFLAAKNFILVRRTIPSATEDYIYFCDLAPNNLPSVATRHTSNCIVEWYSCWPGRRRDVNSLRHSVRNSRTQSLGQYELCYQQSPIPTLTRRTQQLHFFLFFLATLLYALRSFCNRHWWNIIIYHESIASLLARLQTELLAKEYWFHNSRLYPPLWTYELPSKASKCIYYFYSTNCEPFLFRNDRNIPFLTPYSIMNWPEYLVWDKYQHSFVKLCHSDCSSIRIVGPISFSDSSSRCSFYSAASPSQSVAVFDVQPFRDSKYQRFGFSSDFYVPDQSISFFSDIASCAAELNLQLLIKRKRDIGLEAHPKYRKFLASLSSCDYINLVDPAISVSSLVKCSIGSISMPYTSTAIVFREFGIPAIYYAPLTARRVSPSASHGIPLVKGVDNLRSWMINLITAKAL